jgi:proteasome activator subunit 4
LFDTALDIFFTHVANSPRSNSGKAVGHLTSCFARANPEKTLAKFLPLCVRNIRVELEHGASSVRTTSTTVPFEGDTTLHWYCLLLIGALTQGGPALLKYQDELVALLRFMIEKCKSERGYTFAGRLVSNLLGNLSTIWPLDTRSTDKERWNSEGMSSR